MTAGRDCAGAGRGGLCLTRRLAAVVDDVARSARTATPGDLPRISALLGDAQLPLADCAERIADFRLAEWQGRVVGVVALQHCDGDGLLRSLVIDREWRGGGLGAQLVRTVERQAHADGLYSLYLLTETAQGYFQRLGYAVVERNLAPGGIVATQQFRALCPATAQLMCRHLATPDGD